MEQTPAAASRGMAKVMVVSDEPVAARVWEFAVRQLGFDTLLVPCSGPVIETFTRELPDLIIMEDANERTEEFALLQQLRELTVVPLLLLTAKTGELFQLKVYEAGVDECIPYPITPRLFQAKVTAWMRRTRSIPMSALDDVRAGGFQLNPGRRQLRLPRGTEVHLTSLESRALCLFLNHPGQSFAPDEVIEKVWGYSGSGEGSLLKHLVFRLRRKIEPDPNHPRYLVNERGTGYRFIA
jgi:DNA-binding response OmpR family regulator